jgi:hypothetical protein
MPFFNIYIYCPFFFYKAIILSPYSFDVRLLLFNPSVTSLNGGRKMEERGFTAMVTQAVNILWL